MSDLSNYAESKIYDWATGRANAPAAVVPYLALFTAVSDAEAGTGTEVAAVGYARQQTAFGADSNGAGSNTAAERFGPLAGTGTATHAALFDAVSGGNAITAIKALAASKTWADGDIIEFAIGEVDFAML